MANENHITTPILLEKSYRQHIARHDVDYQLRMYDLGATRPEKGSDPTLCLVVLTRSDDMEVSDLSLGLARRGIRLLRVNRDDIAGRAIGALSPQGVINSHGEELLPLVIWRRHFKDPIDIASEDYLVDKYVHDQMDAFPATLAEVTGRSINNGTEITSRLAQISSANAFGFPVPPSLVTHNLAMAADRLGGDAHADLIVKPLGSHWTEVGASVMAGNFPTRVSSAEARLKAPEPVPVLVQRYIPHDYEIRVFIIGDTLVAYSVTEKRSADSLWESPDAVHVEQIELDRELATQILQFSKDNRIDLGAIEFMVRKDGSLVFLEVNLLFDWRFFQSKASDSRVTDCLVDYFVRESTW